MHTVIYGFHPVCETLKKRPQAVHRISLSSKRRDVAMQHIESLAQEAGIVISYEPQRTLAQLARSENHQGIVARIDQFPLASLEEILGGRRCSEHGAFFLVLDSVQDPHNFGALLRSAVCCGVEAVIFPKDRSAPLSGTVAKASAGAIEHIRLCRVVNIAVTLDKLKDENIWTLGLAPRAQETIYGFDFRRDLALVVGGEGRGLRSLVQKKCDVCLSIPMAQSFESLNASAAGAVAMFEVMRQREYV